MIDPYAKKGVEALTESVNGSYWLAGQQRRRRVDNLKQYVGGHYSDNGASEKVPVPYITTYVDTITGHLAGNTPVACIDTPIDELKAAAFDLEFSVNQALVEMRFKTWLQRVVKDSLFGFGVLYVGVAEADRGFGERAGDVYVQTIDQDDWVQDMSQRHFEHAAYLGFRGRHAVADIIDDDTYNTPDGIEWREQLRRTSGSDGGPSGLESGASQEIGGGTAFGQSLEAETHVDVWHIWLPREGLVVSLPGERSEAAPVLPKALRIMPSTGSRTGPFKVLGHGGVPGNAVPLAPVAKIRDLHDISNAIYSQLAEDGTSERTVLAYESTAARDVERIQRTPNGGTVRVDRIDKIKPFHYGGASGVGISFGIHLDDKINFHSGNIRSLGGLSAAADTYGQERLISKSASQQIAAMQDAVQDFVIEVLREVAWKELTNPYLERIVARRLGSFTFEEYITYDGLEPLQARFFELNFKLRPYSLQPRTPADDLAALDAFMTRWVDPYMGAGLLEPQGIMPNFDGLLRVAARLSGIEHLVTDVLNFSSVPTIPTHHMRGTPPPSIPITVNRPQGPPRPALPAPDAGGMSSELMKGLLKPQPSPMVSAA